MAGVRPELRQVPGNGRGLRGRPVSTAVRSACQPVGTPGRACRSSRPRLAGGKPAGGVHQRRQPADRRRLHPHRQLTRGQSWPAHGKGGQMKIGIAGANTAVFAERDHAIALARTAEAAGVESLWTYEHIAVPASYQSAYPYSPSGRMPAEGATFPDALDWIAFLSGVTERIRFGTG